MFFTCRDQFVNFTTFDNSRMEDLLLKVVGITPAKNFVIFSNSFNIFQKRLIISSRKDKFDEFWLMAGKCLPDWVGCFPHFDSKQRYPYIFCYIFQRFFISLGKGVDVSHCDVDVFVMTSLNILRSPNSQYYKIYSVWLISNQFSPILLILSQNFNVFQHQGPIKFI